MSGPVKDTVAVAFQDVSMAFDGRKVMDHLTCAFERGRITVILGGSGSGKSTLLRLVAGLIVPQSGSIAIEGQDITRLDDADKYEIRRNIGMMFQQGALLDSISVFDNLAFPLREHTEMSEAEINEEVCDRLDAVGLANADRLLPGQLSGGMLKRAALARAIIQRPKILLCDEPFSGLDPISVKRIEALLVHINERFDMTTLLVSHHVATTLRMADRVLVLTPARAYMGSPEEMRNSDDPLIHNLLSDELSDDIDELEPEAGPQL